MRIPLIFVGLLSMACLWDNDTVEMELQQFPGTIEIIAGNFLRHSPEYYYWRIQDRKEKLETADSLIWYDDMAVAYSKLGQDKKAIEIATNLLEKAPRRYETFANLGTFYIHDGQYRQGLTFLEEAIKINPEAHFGREKYQIYLVEYLLNINWEEEKLLPLDARFPRRYGFGTPHHLADFAKYDSVFKKRVEQNPQRFRDDDLSFYDYLLAQYRKTVDPSTPVLPKDELKKAIEGISGMLKFGNYNSPVLIEALGELLAYNNDQELAHRHLAILAYLRAGELSDDPKILAIYQTKMKVLVQFIAPEKQKSLAWYQEILAKEVKAADELMANITRDEINWIISGKNPEAEFANKYYGASKTMARDWDKIDADAPNRGNWRALTGLPDTIQRLKWIPQSEVSNAFDPALKSFVDSTFAVSELRIEPDLEQETKSESDWTWYIIIACLAITIGGLYAFKNYLA